MTTQPGSSEFPGVPSHVIAMEAFAGAHFREPIRVSDIAAAVGLHPAYASILYSRTRGTTLIRHLTQLRINYARERLSRPGAPAVVRVAFESGFCSLSSFYDAFRKLTNQTPTQAAQDPTPAAIPARPSATRQSVRRGGRARQIVHALWVDDQPPNNIDERRALGEMGIFADSYQSSDDARAALERGGYRFVLSDIRRASQDSGLDFAREIRARYPDLPVFFYCGYVNDERRSLALQIGAVGVFDRSEDLYAAVRAYLATRGRAG